MTKRKILLLTPFISHQVSFAAVLRFLLNLMVYDDLNI